MQSSSARAKRPQPVVVTGAWVTRRNPVCLRSTPLGFAAIGLAPEAPFPSIDKAQRYGVRLKARRRVGELAGVSAL
jgi:hypothetical protein